VHRQVHLLDQPLVVDIVAAVPVGAGLVDMIHRIAGCIAVVGYIVVAGYTAVVDYTAVALRNRAAAVLVDRTAGAALDCSLVGFGSPDYAGRLVVASILGLVDIRLGYIGRVAGSGRTGDHRAPTW